MPTEPQPNDVSDAKVLREVATAAMPDDPVSADPAFAPQPEALRPAGPRRASVALMFSSPLHMLSLGFGSGLSPVAPGTMGTLWAWASFAVASHWLGEAQWAWVLAAGVPIGWWACTRTAQAMATADPSAVVWDEILAFWAILWLVLPGGFGLQLAAFALFRYFDAAKPGPVGWADQLFKCPPGQTPGWAQGFGILFDDLVAALCTLMVLALWRVW
ncbi:MAG: phosphatidylglycerophosphatase A [Vitreoscilla sp.]|nr:phosphatidylglycerophosphatase A [Vitreoscilla sp.]MBP6674324.1 phosphatidylglycerophosphatase A [Vitreoscilla sp.]